MGSVSDNLVELDIVVKLPPNTTPSNINVCQFPVIAATRPIAYLKRLWTHYFPPGVFGEVGITVVADPVVEVEELPHNQTSSITNVYPFLVEEEGVMMPGPTFKFVITGLLSFTAIKSQGETRFPFHTHPQTTTVAITSLLAYGLASAAEDAISAARPGSSSVYAFIARLGRKLCLCILVAALAFLFYL